MHLLCLAYSCELGGEVSLRISNNGSIHIKVLGVSGRHLLTSHLFDFFPEEMYKLTANFDLAVSKLIVSGFGGRIYTHSRADKTSYVEFILELPKLAQN